MVQEDFDFFRQVVATMSIPMQAPEQWRAGILGGSIARIRVRMGGQQQLHLITPAALNGQIQRMDARDNLIPRAAAFLDVSLRVRAIFQQDFHKAGVSVQSDLGALEGGEGVWHWLAASAP